MVCNTALSDVSPIYVNLHNDFRKKVVKLFDYHVAPSKTQLNRNFASIHPRQSISEIGKLEETIVPESFERRPFARIRIFPRSISGNGNRDSLRCDLMLRNDRSRSIEFIDASQSLPKILFAR